MKKLFLIIVFFAFVFIGRSQYSENHNYTHNTQQLYHYREAISTSGTLVTEDVSLDLFYEEYNVSWTELEIWADPKSGYENDTNSWVWQSWLTNTLYVRDTFNYDSSHFDKIYYLWTVYYSDNTWEEYYGVLQL